MGDAAIAKKLESGACRGSGWQSGIWPVAAGLHTRKSCAETCIRTTGCTAFDVRNPTDFNHHHHDVEAVNKYECSLYGHKAVVSASGVPADCYTITLLDPSQIPAKKPKKVNKPTPAPAPANKSKAGKKEPKIPVFKEPKVLEDEHEITDEGWLFEPPPPEVRSRKHIDTILHLSDVPVNITHILQSIMNILEMFFNRGTSGKLMSFGRT